jgi:hypothetical protein
MENLKVTEREMSLNEWVVKFNVSSQHQKKTDYYQGNPSVGIKPVGVAKYLDETPFERFLRVLFIKINKLLNYVSKINLLWNK